VVFNFEKKQVSLFLLVLKKIKSVVISFLFEILLKKVNFFFVLIFEK
jgi:hypothetical protein